MSSKMTDIFVISIENNINKINKLSFKCNEFDFRLTYSIRDNVAVIQEQETTYWSALLTRHVGASSLSHCPHNSQRFFLNKSIFNCETLLCWHSSSLLKRTRSERMHDLLLLILHSIYTQDLINYFQILAKWIKVSHV
jgi:hypothetical protein